MAGGLPVETIISIALKNSGDVLECQRENEELREEFAKNLQLLDDLDTLNPQVQFLQQRLNRVNEQIEQEQMELISLQNAIIKTLKAKPKESKQSNSFLIPLILNQIQQLVAKQTENATENGNYAVLIADLYRLSDSFGEFLEFVEEKGLIAESDGDKLDRLRKYNSTKQMIANKVKDLVQRQREDSSPNQNSMGSTIEGDALGSVE